MDQLKFKESNIEEFLKKNKQNEWKKIQIPPSEEQIQKRYQFDKKAEYINNLQKGVNFKSEILKSTSNFPTINLKERSSKLTLDLSKSIMNL